MAKGFGRTAGNKRAFSDDEIRWIELWEQFFDLRNGDLTISRETFDSTFWFFAGKRLNDGQRADWQWLLNIFERHDTSRKESREQPLQLPNCFPRNIVECQRINTWRAANPRG